MAKAQDADTLLQLKTASGHPMQYYMSLPQGWTAAKKWPVVVIIECANRQFRENAERFVRARQKMPFILVAPLVVTNGGPRYREAPSYRYSEAVWDRITREGEYRFDMDGIAAVMADVRKLYGGEDKFFITGWEAGGHTVWAMVFQHPEALRAAALVCPNYAGRGMDEKSFSSSAARSALFIRGFYGTEDAAWGPNRPLTVQWERAKAEGRAHGFRNISLASAPGKGHEPLASEVLAFFLLQWKGE